jgi:hypothetical protein
MCPADCTVYTDSRENEGIAKKNRKDMINRTTANAI